MKPLAISLLTLCALLAFTTTRAAEITPAEARSIARDAYIYGYPLVDSYRIQYASFVDRSNPEFKAPWNEVTNVPHVFTPDAKAIPALNSDTPYAYVGLDLRTEPMVLTVPEIEQGRYFSVQLIDSYTHNLEYISSRTFGNDGGNYLIAGPGWKGKTPNKTARVLRSGSWFVLMVLRTQLLNSGDVENVKKVQAGFKVQPLSALPFQTSAAAAPAIEFIKPLAGDELRSSLEFFNILNFVLQFCPTHPSEFELMERFARINVGGGRRFDSSKFSPKVRKAVAEGMADAWKAYEELLETEINRGTLTAGELFGSRKLLKNNYLYRMAGAVIGIYGNSKEEAVYPVYPVEDGSKGNYVLRFSPGELPPVYAFWSITMYEMPSSKLVANPLNRYLINSAMLPSLKLEADGGLTLYVQRDSPGKELESNWLPAPNGPFKLFMRLYWPKRDALNGKWTSPPLMKAR